MSHNAHVVIYRNMKDIPTSALQAIEAAWNRFGNFNKSSWDGCIFNAASKITTGKQEGVTGFEEVTKAVCDPETYQVRGHEVLKAITTIIGQWDHSTMSGDEFMLIVRDILKSRQDKVDIEELKVPKSRVVETTEEVRIASTIIDDLEVETITDADIARLFDEELTKHGFANR